MNVEVLHKPAGAMARIQLNPQESIVAESGAMVGMSPNVDMQTQSGGLKKGIKRLFGGESFFRNTFTASQTPGEVLLAHTLPGDIETIPLSGQPGDNDVHIQSTSYIASTPNVEINTKVGGFKSFFAGEGIFVLKATVSDPGALVVGAFGGIQQMICDGNLIIDTGHLVAWDAHLKYKIKKSSKSIIGSFLSGEGLVCQFEGKGRIWIQTRHPGEYGKWIGPQLPPRS